MSADVLRRAAALMRERAEAATRGPWITGESWAGPNPVMNSDGHPLTVCGDGGSAELDAEHIASWHPAVALAVADWLDVAADRFDSRLSSALMQTDDVDKAIRGCEHLGRRAIAVARAYLGEQS